MIINIYVANHGKRDGIEDFITILTDIFSKRGHEVNVTEELCLDSINLIIDEFTNIVNNLEISEFKKKYPEVKIVYVLTEFIEKKYLVKSFNFFGSLVDAALIAAMTVYFRRRRKDFIALTFKEWLIAAAYAPLLLIYVGRHILLNLLSKSPIPLLKKVHSPAYMLMRYLGLEKMISNADAVILSHDLIADGLKEISTSVPILGTLYPEIDWDKIKNCVFKDKELFCEITGSITPYRHRQIMMINQQILALGLTNTFGLCQAISFGQGVNLPLARGGYSLHPPQSEKWKYSSPTRIFRALQYDCNIPVLTRVFNQHPIENLGLAYNGDETLFSMYRYFKYPEALTSFIEPKVMEYVELSRAKNNELCRAIENMA